MQSSMHVSAQSVTRASLGWVPGSAVRVPEHFRNVKLALLNMTEGQKLLLDKGRVQL